MRNKIFEFRKKWKLTREDLASKVGVSWITIYRWETRKTRPHQILWKKLERVMKGYEASKK